MPSGVAKQTHQYMYLLVMQFHVPQVKLHEFNLAIDRLVKWPVYSLHNSEGDDENIKFELIREWDDEQLMKSELEGLAYENLLGMIKVLGELTQSKIYNIPEETNLLQKQTLS